MLHKSFELPPSLVDLRIRFREFRRDFHTFKFHFPVLFVQGYCSPPNSFYEVFVIFGAPYSVQWYLAVRVDNCFLVFVTVYCLICIKSSTILPYCKYGKTYHGGTPSCKPD